MAQIAFPSHLMMTSQDFAREELTTALSGKDIKNLTGLERDSINSHLRNLANGEQRLFLRNVFLTSLVAGSLFVLLVAVPAIYTVFAITYAFPITLNVSLGILTLAISSYVLPNIFFKFEDLKRECITLHKHNRDALIFAANEIKRTKLRSIPLDEKDKAILQEVFHELDSSILGFVNPIKVRNLMRLGNEISKSIKHKDTSYVINLLAYIFVDPEIHQSVENVLGSSAKKAIVVWFINYFISDFIAKFSNLVGHDKDRVRDLLLSLNFHGFLDLLLS